MTNDSFLRYAEEYTDMVFRLAFHYLGTKMDAEDVTQNVLIKLYQSEKSFDSQDHVRNWLVRVTVNECKSLFRSGWRHTESLDELGEASAPPVTLYDPFGHGRAGPEEGGALAAVMRLPAKYRVVIYLYYYEEYDTGEIAELLHIPAATVRTRLARGRERLKQNLKEVATE
ncbi:MAG: sigma-70 family RNA polymerase sigma factor [Clostridiales bacterium]|nr:sigma-70 family RNA polymerase sigma factor [Clostridiales bacterium]